MQEPTLPIRPASPFDSSSISRETEPPTPAPPRPGPSSRLLLPITSPDHEGEPSDVVLPDHPFSVASEQKVRPLVVVQAEIRNALLSITLPPPALAGLAKETDMIELTPEQRQELTHPEPIAVDPKTKEQYVLVRKEIYDRLTGILGDDWASDTYAASMEVFAREGWDDPRMDVYDELHPRKKPR